VRVTLNLLPQLEVTVNCEVDAQFISTKPDNFIEARTETDFFINPS